MTRTLAVACVAALIGMFGCKEKKRKDGLPPANEWQVDKNKGKTSQENSNVPDHKTNPHAGLGIPNPHGGGGDDPHGGMSMGKGNPHGGGMGMTPRKGHPDRTLAGVLTLGPKVKGKLPTGSKVALYIYAKFIDKKTNQPTNTIATKKISSYKFPFKFHLDESSAMSTLPLSGTVIFEARVDSDGDATTRSKGDVLGRIKVKVPNTKLKVSLDTILDSDSRASGM